ncbi:PREDICTED: cytochrome P450 2U1-like, partial [Branchiostoma belcheri]|uniref:Cytochrome P450 2U1-like n=1 Tax=Branchiostoma belcheri TaxID=7741 RepID=A0A6P4ZLJ0_BRABE
MCMGSPYVNACLLEVMRIRTVVPLSIPHTPSETVKVRGYDIPKGTQVLPNLYSVHMDPAYWPDPARFDPGRFLDAEGNVINKPESFMPFSGASFELSAMASEIASDQKGLYSKLGVLPTATLEEIVDSYKKEVTLYEEATQLNRKDFRFKEADCRYRE